MHLRSVLLPAVLLMFPLAATAAGTATFDPIAATDAYLAMPAPAARAKSDAYFEGGYWLLLWNCAYGMAIAWLLLASRLSLRMRQLAERVSHRLPAQAAIYGAGYVVVTALLSFPLTVYTDFFREHQYGLANQRFGEWLIDALKALGVSLVIGALTLMAIYTVIRRAPRNWWVWGAVVGVALIALAALVAPVFIAPLFNEYKPLADPQLRAQILSMARANGVPADEVYEFDASKQTTRISANVSGFAGSMRISLNDNLLERATPAEIRMVMAHETGHYVLHHVYKNIVFTGLLLVAGLAFARWGFAALSARYGAAWGVREVADPAGLPLLVALLSVFLFVATPVINTLIRAQEAEADIFGLNASREPDAFASIALKLAEYRKLAPGPLEEFIFYDHPSGRSRILMAMRWKAEHLAEVSK